MTDDALGLLATGAADVGELAVEGSLRPRSLDEYIGQREVKASLRRAAPGGEGQGRGRGPRPALRPAGPRQDDPRDHRRPRARRERPVHERPRGRRGRPRRDPHGPRRAGRAVHRRDPPPQPRRRGDPLPGDGGLRPRRDDRQGSVGPQPAARLKPVHGGRRDDPGRADQRAAAGPLRHDLPAGLLRRGRPDLDRPAVRGDPRRRGGSGSRSADRHARRAGRRGSSTASCAASATTPRSTGTDGSTRRRSSRR